MEMGEGKRKVKCKTNKLLCTECSEMKIFFKILDSSSY